MLRPLWDWIGRQWHHALFAVTSIGVLGLAGFMVWAGLDQVWQPRLVQFPPVIGALLGPFLGLTAILLGALYNAKLNRDRDDQVREQEARALASALAAESFSMANGLDVLKSQVVSLGNGREIAAEDLWRPTFSVYHGNIHRIGMLGGTLDAEVVDTVHAILESVRTIAAHNVQIRSDKAMVKDGQQRIDNGIEHLGILRGRLNDRASGLSPEPVPLPETPVFSPVHTSAPE